MSLKDDFAKDDLAQVSAGAVGMGVFGGVSANSLLGLGITKALAVAPAAIQFGAVVAATAGPVIVGAAATYLAVKGIVRLLDK